MKLIIITLLLIFIYGCTSPTNNNNNNNNKSLYNSAHIELGLPCDKDNSDDYLIFRDQYVLSYNNIRGVANWVCWELSKNWDGTIKRYKGDYLTDTSLPTHYKRISHYDYTNSGYDRGHIVRSEERTKTESDNISTFYLTNIIPQLNKLNGGAWLNLENECKRLCFQENKRLLIIAGGIFQSKRYLNNNNRVMIPDYCFKIVVALGNKENYKDININTKIIAVLMPNDLSKLISNDYTDYLTTIDTIERLSEYDFLSNIDPKIQDIIEH